MAKPQTTAALVLVKIEGKHAFVDTTGTRAAPGDKIVYWELHWGDSQYNADPGKPTLLLDHEYLEDDEYQVFLLVKDSKNRQVVSPMIIVKVGPVIIQNPLISSLNPVAGGVGSNLGINGVNFGAQQGSSIVTVNGVAASVTSWSDTFITVIVPNTTTGPVIVTVNGIPSNGVAFTIQVIETVDIITPNQLPAGIVGTQTQIQFQASGGTPPYSFTVGDELELPPGLSLASDGTYTGIPTTEGTFIFTVEVVDSLGNGGIEEFTQDIGPADVIPLEILTQNVPSGAIGSFYSQQLQGSGGVTPYSWFLFSGSLPPGLSLSGDTIQGTPTTNGSFNFTIRLRDNVGTEVFRSYQIIISGTLVIVNSSPLPTASLGSSYSVQFQAANGTAPYTFTRISGNFPTGLSLNGVILSGTPTTLQTSIFTIRVIDSTGATFDKQFNLTVTNIAPSLYFDELRVLPECIRSLSLRRQSELDDVVSAPPSTFFTYIFGSDPYPTPKDAAKLLVNIDRGDIPGNQQLKILFGPVLHSSGGRILITWDFWWGREFRDNIILSSMNAWKAFRTQSGGGGTNMGFPKIHFSSKIGPGDGAGPLSIGCSNGTFSGNGTQQGLARPLGILTNDPIDPPGVNSHVQATRQPSNLRYHVHYGKWIRYWIELRLNQPRTAFSEWETAYGVTLDSTGDRRYTMASLWAAQEDRDVARLIYRVPWNLHDTGYSRFDFEMDSSIHALPALTAPVIAYSRNVVILLNYSSPAFDSTTPENDTFLFRKPID